MAISDNTAAAPIGLDSVAPGREARAIAAPIAGQHIGALDGLRGIAILLVLFYHYGSSARDFGFDHPLLKASAIGWCGVDLFFVLSGFLITGILFDSRDNAHYYRNFYARRALRVFPVYYSALIVVVILSLAWPGAGHWGTHSNWWLAFYLTNFLIAVAGPAAAGITSHFWSLAVEEHFYLFWPMLVAWLSRHRIIIAALGLIALGFVVRLTFLTADAGSDASYMLTPARIDALAIGALCALALRGPFGLEKMVRPAWIAVLTGGAAILLIILTRRTLSYDDPYIQSVGLTLLPVAFAGILVLSLAWQPLSTIFNTGVLRWFGRYSYGLYVWHPIINVLLFYTAISRPFLERGTPGLLVLLGLGLALSLSAAVVSYHGMEKHFLALKRHFG